MDKLQIADILCSNGTLGAIPVLLDIDNQILDFDFQKISGFLFLGNNSFSNIMKIVNQIGKQYNKTQVDSVDDLQRVYDDMINAYTTNTELNPPEIIIIKDTEAIYNSSQLAKDMLIDVLRRGHGVKLYFICGAKDKKLPEDISINFSVKIEDFYTNSQSPYNAIFDYIGRRQKIKLN